MEEVIRLYFPEGSESAAGDVRKYARILKEKCEEEKKEKYYFKPMEMIALSTLVTLFQEPGLQERFDEERGPLAIKKEVTCANHICETVLQKKDVPQTTHAFLYVYGDHLPSFGPKDVQHLSFLEKAVCVKGVVIRSGVVKVRVRSYVFQCGKCKTFIRTDPFHGNTFNYPAQCTKEKCKNTKFDVKRSECEYIDWQQIWVQQDWKSKEGDRSTLLVNLTGEQAGLAEAGDRVEVFGVMQQSLLGNARVDSRASYALEADFVEGCGDTRKLLVSGVAGPDGVQESDLVFSPMQLQFIREIFTDQDRFALVAASICPTIVGRPLIKAALALVLFGGKVGTGRRRTDQIHMLLCGDPGLGKSKLLQAMSSLSNEGSFISGAACTTAGLTAAVIHQDHTVVLEAGALPLADGGVCCIDEFDKMPKIHQDGLLEAMEQQTVTVAKAGIVSQLNARTSVLCACNPKNQGADFLSKALLSRFDIVMYLKDNVNIDEMIAKHLLDSRMDTDHTPQHDPMAPTGQRPADLGGRISSYASDALPDELLKCYVNYARRYCPAPTLSSEAKVRIKELYFARRLESERQRSYGGSNHTFRYFEALIRLSEARAKGDLYQEVQLHHVEDVAEILRAAEANEEVTVNNKRPRPGTVKSLLFALKNSRATFWTRQEILDIAASVGFDVVKAENALENLNLSGEILKSALGYRMADT